jgi:ankyrin repeat protein
MMNNYTNLSYDYDVITIRIEELKDICDQSSIFTLTKSHEIFSALESEINSKSFKNLLNENKDFKINDENDQGQTAFMLGIKFENDEKTLSQIILSHANVNHKDKEENTTLMYALKYYVKNKKPIQLLIQQEANVNHQNKDGDSPFMFGKKYFNDKEVI